jgi:hypothetical protein
LSREKLKKYYWEKYHRVNEQGIIERQCTKCNEWIEENLENFYLKNKKKPELGFSSQCKKCLIKSAGIRQDENKEYYQEVKRNWYEQNKEQELNRYSNWYQDNKEHRREYMNDFYQNNKDLTRQYQVNRKPKNHKISKSEWIACKAYFGNCCAYCGLPIEKHLILRKGKLILGDFHKEHYDDQGANDLSNCLPSCGSCNSKKWIHPFKEWYTPDNPIFSQERLDKINKWLNEDYKLYIEEKKPRKPYTKNKTA